MDAETCGWLVPDWPAPSWVRGYTTTRAGGVSKGAYASWNLADHVGDDQEHVRQNRQRLISSLHLPAKPVWLQQVHGIDVVDAGHTRRGRIADASFTTRRNVVCAVLTADCLPVLLCDDAGRCVAAVHAGWRGLAAGIIEATVKAMQLSGSRLMAWLGPAIGPEVFEVGDEVRAQFVAVDADASSAFRRSDQGRWLADIYLLARQRLARMGVGAVYGGHWCTVTDAERFYSYRRDGITGRMATIVVMDEAQK